MTEPKMREWLKRGSNLDTYWCLLKYVSYFITAAFFKIMFLQSDALTSTFDLPVFFDIGSFNFAFRSIHFLDTAC